MEGERVSGGIDPNTNCHAYCPYGKMCRYCKGENGLEPYDCTMYYKLDDINNEAKEIENEQRKQRERKFEEVEDW